ncbi:MAG TPA: DUF1499 domain-containing protein [Albitalea sp.]|nr:DUF1499 domain-containing protein [Albitalea sp.]
METPASSSSRIGTFASACLVLVAACGIGELLGGLGYRWGWWGLEPGIQTVRWSATADVVLVVLAAGAAIRAWRRRASRALTIAFAALLLGIAIGGPPVYMLRLVARLPHIHDISTDLDNPPRFVAVLPLRQGAHNPPDYDPKIVPQQRAGYPDIAPLLLDRPPAQVFEAAERNARAMGWDIAAAVPQEGRIEATDTSLLFGFKDDVVIRVAPHGSGTQVDLRSLSRVGGSDFGVNAKRVRSYLQHLAADTAGR